MQELDFHAGEDTFVESFSPENQYGVVFEDDGETGYFYAVEKDKDGHGLRVLDALHIYEGDEGPGDPDSPDASGSDDPDPGDPESEGLADDDPADAPSASHLQIVWSRDWLKCALVIDGYCQAIFDFQSRGGYNINEFPPPNDVWTQGGRELTDEMISRFF